MFSRDLNRRLAFGMFMRNADKGGGSGGDQKPPTVPELTQRVKDLENENASLKQNVETATQAKDDAIAAQQKAEGERDEANKAKDTAVAAQQKAEGERDEANKAKDTAVAAQQKAEGEAKQAKEDLKTTDERTEARLREISAANGGTLPPKKPGAGDHTVDQPADQSLPPVKRLAAGMKVAGE